MRWLGVINTRLTDDIINASRIKRDKTYSALVSATLIPILSRDRDLVTLTNWTINCEVLVGMSMLRPPPERGCAP